MPAPSDMAPVLYAPGDLVPVPLDLEALLFEVQNPLFPESEKARLRALMAAQYAINPHLPIEVTVRMPSSLDIQRILQEKAFATEALEAKAYDLDEFAYAERRVALESRYQAKILDYVEPLPAGSPFKSANELPAAIVNHLWETIVQLASGLTLREVQGSTGRSGGGSPGPETTTASPAGARVVDATIPPPTKKASAK